MSITFIIYHNFKKISVQLFACCVFTCLSCFAVAQSAITFDAGQNFSTYKYTDSQGEIKDFTSGITGCFSLGYQYLAPGGLLIRSGLGMRRAGASLEYNKRNVEWNIQYADINVGVGYLLNKWRIKPYVAVSPYFAYMLQGVQTVGQTKYDIKKNETMSPVDFGVNFSPGVKVELSNTISFYAEYRQLLGLQNLETGSASDQKTYNRGFSVNLGISVAIIRYNYVTTQ